MPSNSRADRPEMADSTVWPALKLPTFRGQFQTATMALGGLCHGTQERRHHTREFKLEAVRLAAVGDKTKTKAKVARDGLLLARSS
jgi:hypothetical protein